MGEAAASVSAVGDASVRSSEKSAAASKRSMGAIGGVAGIARGAVMGVAAAATVAIAEGAKLGINFQTQMEMVHTQAGASQHEVDALRGSVLALATQSPQGPGALAQGLFFIESHAIRGARAMEVLKQSVRLATVGNITNAKDFEDVVRVLAGTVDAYGVGVQGTANISATLSAIVGQGSLRMHDLIQALGSGLLPVAQALHLSLRDVGAALDVTTSKTVPATRAATRLRTTLGLMAAPSGAAQTALAGIHMSATQMHDDLQKPKGLIVALEDLHDHLTRFGGTSGEQFQTLASIFGRSRQSAEILTLIQHIDELKARYAGIGQQAGDFNNNVLAAQRTDAVRLRVAWSSLQVALIQLWNVVRPLLIPALLAVTHLLVVMTKLLQGDIQWWQQHKHMFDLVAIAIAGMTAAWVTYKLVVIAARIETEALTAAKFISYWYDFTKAAGVATTAMYLFDTAMLANPIGVIALIVAAVVAIIVVLVLLQLKFNIFGKAAHAIAIAAVAAWNWMVGAFWTVVHTLGKAWDWFKTHWQTVLFWIFFFWVGIILEIVFRWHAITHALSDAWHSVWATIKTTASDGFNWIKDRFNDFINWNKRLPGRLSHAGGSLFHWIPKAFKAAFNAVIHLWNGLHFAVGKVKVAGHTIFPGINIKTPNLPTLASGGDIAMSGFAMVGEAGPEILHLPQGARVEPLSHVSRSAPTGLSYKNAAQALLESRPIENHNHLYLDGKQIYKSVSRTAEEKATRR
jgi:TP901 family phage tail tape measure protein